jgi:hypothetical protein
LRRCRAGFQIEAENEARARDPSIKVETTMKVLVPVKRVVDYNVKVRVKSDNTGVDVANVKMSMNQRRDRTDGRVMNPFAGSGDVAAC